MEDIKVHVTKYPDRDNYVMRYADPITGKRVVAWLVVVRQQPKLV